MPRKSSPSSSPEALTSFETEFERLTSIVDRLEAGNVPLNEMLKLYEEGMTLSTRLKDVLSEAELRVEKLAKIHEEKLDTAQRGPANATAIFEDDAEETDQDELLF